MRSSLEWSSFPDLDGLDGAFLEGAIQAAATRRLNSTKEDHQEGA
jgi:hypothetical protein